MIARACFDAIFAAIHVVVESIALLLGAHLVLILHLVHLFATNPVEGARQTASAAGAAGTAASQIPAELAERFRSRPAPQQSPQHLPALGPRPIDEASHKPVRPSLLTRVNSSMTNLSDRTATQLRDIADNVEGKGGTAGRLVTRMRRCESHVDQRLVNRLPPELVLHILSLAAVPGTPQAIPTKIAMLSKTHYRFVIPRIYSCVNLSDSASFRRFRMTLAVHNPKLGQHVRSLSVASSAFDSEGYLPEQVAEHVTLGVGIEQILLAVPNLRNLYLDLFSLAALHHGTASRLEKGALPVSLTTEFSLPQYLTLPTFSCLKHVELTVFGLDNNAIDWFRQVLPRLKSLSLRWVTRRSTSALPVEHVKSDVDITQAAWDDQDDADLDLEERLSWRTGGRRHHDFLLFVEAVELLRRWPYHAGHEHTGQQLRAVSVFAWPKAYRELRKHYNSKMENVHIEGVTPNVVVGDEAERARQWNKSLPSFGQTNEMDDFTSMLSPQPTPVLFINENRPFFERVTSQAHVNGNGNGNGNGTPVVSLPPAPLRLAVDESHTHGPRRGPLMEWSAGQRVPIRHVR